MPQFDVHRSLGRRAPLIPFVLIVQSRRWDFLKSYLVAPLYHAKKVPVLDGRATPLLIVEDVTVILYPMFMFSVLPRALGPLVTRLADPDGDLVIAAIDEAISRAYG